MLKATNIADRLTNLPPTALDDMPLIGTNTFTKEKGCSLSGGKNAHGSAFAFARAISFLALG
jgi:hypothetical protein